jgi:hypothetical protein
MQYITKWAILSKLKNFQNEKSGNSFEGILLRNSIVAAQNKGER